MSFSNQNFKGKINLILGCMFSGKTSELINRYNRYTLGGKKCIMIKYQHDVRYDVEQAVTHDGIKVKALRCQYLYELDNVINDYDVICIDEIQFYKDAHIVCDIWANKGKIVEACGLNGTFERKPFEVISKMLPLVSHIEYLTAICKQTGKHGLYSQRTSNETAEEVIGGEDKYCAADRLTYFKEVNNKAYTLNQIIELIKIIKNYPVDIDLTKDDIDDKSLVDIIQPYI